MGQSTTVFVLLLAVLSLVSAQVTYNTNPATILDGSVAYGQSVVVTITSDSTLPASNNTINLSCNGCLLDVPSVFFPQADGGSQSKSFTVTITAADPGTATISFAQTGSSADFNGINTIGFVPARAQFNVNLLGGTQKVGVVSNGNIKVNYAPVGAVVTATLSSIGGVVTFVPPSFTWTAGQSDERTFTYRPVKTSSGEQPEKVTIIINIGGAAASRYAAFTPQNVTVRALVLDFDYPALTYGNRVWFHTYEDSSPQRNPVESLTVSPSATGLVFTPNSVTLNPVTNANVEGTMSMELRTSGDVMVNLGYSGADWSPAGLGQNARWSIPDHINITINKLAFSLANSLSGLTVGSWVWNTASLNSLPLNPVTVTLASTSNAITFEPSTVTFNAQTRFVTFRARANFYPTAPVTVYYTVAGTDAPHVADIANATVNVASFTRSQVIGAGATITLAPGQTSASLPVGLLVAPQNSLTIWVNVTGNQTMYTITPQSFTFTSASTNLGALFTITAANGLAIPSTMNVVYTLTGPDAANYVAPTTTTTVSTSNPSYAVAVPNFADVSIYPGQRMGPFTVNVRGIPLTTLTLALASSRVTESGPVLSFQPSTLTFTSTNWAGQFWVTCNNVSWADTADVDIEYTLTPASEIYRVEGATNFVVAGRDVDPSSDLRIIPNPGTITLNPGQTRDLYVYLKNAPLTGSVSVNLALQGYTIAPATLTWAAGENVKKITITAGNAASAASSIIVVQVDQNRNTNGYSRMSGPLAGSFAVSVGKSISVGTLPALTQIGVASSLVKVELIDADTTGLILTPSAPGLTFTPTTITFAAGEKIKYFSYTAATALPGATTVVFTPSGVDAASYTTVTATLSAPTLANNRVISLVFPTGTTHVVNEVFYGYAKIDGTKLTPSGVTVTPQAPTGSGIVFKPDTFVFTTTTTLVAFEVIGTKPTWGVFGSLVNDNDDWTLTDTTGVSVQYAISGADAALYSNIAASEIQIFNYVHVEFVNQDTITAAPINAWQVNKIKLSGWINNQVTLSFRSSDTSVQIEPTTIVVLPNTATINTFDVAFRASTAGVFQVFVDIAGIPADYVTGPLVANNYTLFSTAKSNVQFDNIDFGGSLTVGVKAAAQFWLADNVGTVTITPVDASNNLVFSPTSLTLTPQNPGGQIWATASTVKNSAAATVEWRATVDASVEPFYESEVVSIVGVAAPDCSFTVTNVKLAGFVARTLVCDVDPVVEQTITPSGRFFTFSPASRVVAPGDTRVYFDLQVAGDVQFSRQTAAGGVTDPAVSVVDAEVSVVFGGADFNNVIAESEPRQWATSLTIQPRFLQREGEHDTSNPEYWGNTISVTWAVDAPVVSSLVLTPTADVVGLEFVPASATLVPGQSSATFTLYLDPEALYAYDTLTPARKFSYTVAISGADVNSTYCFNGDCAFGYGETLAIEQYPVLASSMPKIPAFNTKSSDWVVALPIAAINGLTLTPVSDNYEIEFTPSAWVFGAGDTTKAISFVVKADKNGKFTTTDTPSVKLFASGGDARFFNIDPVLLPGATTSFEDDTNPQYAVIVTPSTINVNVGRPFTFQYKLADDLEHADVTEVVITPTGYGATFTPATITLSNASPQATVVGVVNSLASAYSHLSTATESVTVAHLVSGADAAKFGLITASTVTVSRYEVNIDTAPASVIVGTQYGPYKIEADDYFKTDDVLTVSLRAPEGFLITPATTFTFNATNRREYFYFTTAPNAWMYGVSGDILYTVEGSASNYYTVINAVWFDGVVAPRSLNVPSITAVSSRPTYYKFTLSTAAVNGLTITPYGNNLVFTPAVLDVAAGDTEATFSVYTTAAQRSTITYSVSGADAVMYQGIADNYPVTFDASAYTVSMSVDGNSANDFTNRYGYGTVSLGIPPTTYLTVVPQSVNNNIKFIPATFNFTSETTKLAFRYEVTSWTAQDYVTFSYSGPAAGWYTYNPLPVKSIARTKVTMAVAYDSDPATFGSGLKVGVPRAGIATLAFAALPPAGKSVTFTPWCASAKFEPASFTFDANTQMVRFTITGTYMVTDAPIVYTVDDDENYNAPAFGTVTVSKVAFVTGYTPANLFGATITQGRFRRSIQLDTAVDVQITPVAVGPVSFRPAVWNFTSGSDVDVEVIVGESFGVASQAIYVSFAVSGRDANLLAITDLAPVTPTVSATTQIVVPSTISGLIPGQTVTRVITFANKNFLPSAPITVTLSTTGVVVNPTTLTLDANNHWAAFTITLADNFFGSRQIRYAVVSDAGSKWNIGQITSVTTTRSTFILPSFSAGAFEEWTVGAKVGPFTAGIRYAAIADVVLTPSAAGLTFVDAEDETVHALEFSADRMFVDFYVIADSVQHATSVQWAVSGTDAYAYTLPAPVNIEVIHNYFNITSLTSYFQATTNVAGSTTDVVDVFLQHPITDGSSVTFTPSAGGLVFNPPTLTFDANNLYRTLTVSISKHVLSPVYITFDVTVANGFAQVQTPLPVSVTITGTTSGTTRTITSSPSGLYHTLGQQAVYEFYLTVSNPVTSELTVQPTAPGVVFSPAVFNVGATRALFRVVSAERIISTAVPVVFTITGTDAAEFSMSTTPVTIYVDGKRFAVTDFDDLYPGVESRQYTFATEGANGGSPSDSVTVTPWAAGITFSPATFVFDATTAAVDFTMTASDAANRDSRTIHFTVSGPSAPEFAAFDTKDVNVARWTLSGPSSSTTYYTPVGYESDPISIYFDGPVAITSTVTVTPVAYGFVFTPASVDLTPDNMYATFTVTAQFATSQYAVVSLTVTGDIAQYVTTNTFRVRGDSREFTVASYLGINYIGVDSNDVIISLDYLPVSGSVIVTPQAAATTFTPASFEFTSTSAAYASFKFTSEALNGGVISWVLSGTEAGHYNTPSNSQFDTAKRQISVVIGATELLPAESTWVEFSTQYAPPTGITINMGGSLTFDVPSVTLGATTQSARVQISGGPLEVSTTASYTLGGRDAWMYDLLTTEHYLYFYKYEFDVSDMYAAVPSQKLNQPSSPFTIRIPNAYIGQAVTLVPSSHLLVFTPSVFTFDANTFAVTGTYAVNSQVAQQEVDVSSVSISFAVAGPAAALFSDVSSISLDLRRSSGVAPQFTTPYNTLTVPSSVSVIAGVESTSFRVYADAPVAAITVTPYVAYGTGVVFEPASAVIDADNIDAFFTVTAGFIGSATIDFQISGAGAYLFNARVQSSLYVSAKVVTVVRPAYTAGAPLAVYRKSLEYTVSLSHKPSTSVTINFASPSGAVDIYPASITFDADHTSGTYYVIGNTYNAAAERISFSLSGPDAQYYSISGNDYANLFLSTIRIAIDGTLTGWRSHTGTSDTYLSLTSTLPTDVSVDLSADGFVFSPNPVVIPAGSLHAAFSIAATANGLASSPVNIRVTGIETGSFDFVSTYTVSTLAATYAYSGTLAAASQTLLLDQPQSVIVTLSEPTRTELTFRCTSTLFAIPDLVIPVGHSSATVNAVPSSVGVTSVVCNQVGNSIFTASPVANAWGYIRISGRSFRLVSTNAVDYTVTVGGWSAPVDFGLFGASGASAPAASTPNSLNVSFIVSPAGAAVIDPPTIFVEYPASSFTFRMSPRVIGRITVTPVLSGVDAPLYTTAGAAAQAFESVHINGARRTVQLMRGSNLVDRVAGGLAGDSSIRLTVGEESELFTVHVGAVTTDLAISLESPGVVFNPPVLRFTGAYESLTFSMTAHAAYGTSTFVHFILSGADAPWFNAIATQSITTHHKFLIPDFPILIVNQPQTLSITLASNFSSPVVLLPPVGGNVVFQPEAFLFTPEKPTVTFTVIGTASTAELANNYNPVRVSQTNTRPINPTQALTFSWRYMYETGNGYALPFNNGQRSVNVLPAGFVVNFPHLQIGQTSTVTITATVAPRSDVVLTLIGNNLNFNPPSLLFTASNPTATTSVTPVHADYQSSQNIPFTVDYLIAGTNQADYIPPTQSFLAVSRGTAPQADSMLLSAASPAAFASVFLVVASLIALLL